MRRNDLAPAQATPLSVPEHIDSLARSLLAAELSAADLRRALTMLETLHERVQRVDRLCTHIKTSQVVLEKQYATITQELAELRRRLEAIEVLSL